MSRVAAVILSLTAVVVARRRRRSRLPAQAVILTPSHSTVIARDGAVHSLQSAELTVDQAELDRLWKPANLEKLARTYWRFLSRVTMGVIRVVYSENNRAIVLLASPLRLLRLEAPEYTLEAGRGHVRWQILDGLLVSRAGRGSGFLSLDVRRDGLSPLEDRATVRIEVEVANFYPAIAAGFSAFVYKWTQAAVHVAVTHAFLRSLATLDLAESKVGQLAEPDSVTAQP